MYRLNHSLTDNMKRPHDSTKKISVKEIKRDSRVPFHEASFNGYILNDRAIPVELLIKIFCHIDHEILLTCQLVCKHWWMTIQEHVWHQKANLALGKKFPRDGKIPWHAFYLICKKKPFERNLLKNHSGEQGLNHWQSVMTIPGGFAMWRLQAWKIENPPIGVPELPLIEPIFEKRQICFATSLTTHYKEQFIDLEAEGFHPYILDVLQPPILVSEWHSSSCNAIYKCQVQLLKKSDGTIKQLSQFHFEDIITEEKQNQWLYMSHVFENYGPGLRKIRFMHGRQYIDNREILQSIYHQLQPNRSFNMKMARACIYVQIPPVTNDNKTSDDNE